PLPKCPISSKPDLLVSLLPRWYQKTSPMARPGRKKSRPAGTSRWAGPLGALRGGGTAPPTIDIVSESCYSIYADTVSKNPSPCGFERSILLMKKNIGPVLALYP